MSSIVTAELTMVDEVLRGKSRGYILDFSDRTLAEFFQLEFDVEIYSVDYDGEGTSKANRLRAFLKRVDDTSAARVLRRLLDYRQALAPEQRSSIRPLGEGQLLALIKRLERGQGVDGLAPTPIFNRGQYERLRDELSALRSMNAQARGYAFEAYLKTLFDTFHLSAREQFRLTGEQIDGSFQLGNETYLLEAKWHSEKIGNEPLGAFHSKLDQKAAWARGLFVSFSGFTKVGLHAFGRGRRVVCMSGRDIYDALDRNLRINIVLDRKVRHAAETGEPFGPVRMLFP